MTLYIGTPEIKINYGKARLCCRIRWDSGSYDMWYEVEECFGKYLSDERADAFLIAVLPYAMKEAIDVRVEAPLSERLFYQLTTAYIPALAKNTKTYHYIKLECDYLDNTSLQSADAVGAGFSGGVDSFYTVCTHLDTRAEHHKLTHLTFFNVGASGDAGGEEARELFLKRQGSARFFADHNGLNFAAVDSNISEFIKYKHLQTHTMRSFSAVLALQKLFSVYYYSSGCTLGEFSLKKGDEASTYFDLMSAYCLTNENTKFYISGLNESRIEKCAAIADYPLSYRYLNVCLTEGTNCCNCEKCLRTMLAFYAIGKLGLYGDVFDVNGFMANLNKNLIALVENSGNRNYSEIRDAMKENGLIIPLDVRITGNIMRITGRFFPGIRKRLATVKLLRRLREKI